MEILDLVSCGGAGGSWGSRSRKAGGGLVLVPQGSPFPTAVPAAGRGPIPEWVIAGQRCPRVTGSICRWQKAGFFPLPQTAWHHLLLMIFRKKFGVIDPPSALPIITWPLGTLALPTDTQL